MTDPADLAQTLAEELSEALDDEGRRDWGEPWEHLGDAERDVRVLLRGIRELVRRLDQADASFFAMHERLVEERDNWRQGEFIQRERAEKLERENAKLREALAERAVWTPAT